MNIASRSSWVILTSMETGEVTISTNQLGYSHLLVSEGNASEVVGETRSCVIFDLIC